MNNFKEDLFTKKSFIYKIGEDFYAIGADTFAKISDTTTLDTMELFETAYKKNNERQVSKYFEKTMRIANTFRVDAKEHLRLRDKLYAFIDELESTNPEAYKSLEEQVRRFEELGRED